eukprot:jgi/Mesen1/1649/ME000135S00644
MQSKEEDAEQFCEEWEETVEEKVHPEGSHGHAHGRSHSSDGGGHANGSTHAYAPGGVEPHLLGNSNGSSRAIAAAKAASRRREHASGRSAMNGHSRLGPPQYEVHDSIWDAIRAEARLEAEREPLLSSFLYASILAHSCFERSLGFVLANRLKNATLLATQLLDVFDDVLMQDPIRRAIRADVQGYHALQSYRIAHALWNRGQRVLALALQSRISESLAGSGGAAARIGRGILLDHGTGVVIGETAVVGDRVSMLQGVTLGGTGKEAGDRHPKIREGVLIGAGATVLGNITVGRGAMVAAGSLVLKDVPPHSMVAGTPAKVVGMLEEPTPSLTMKHDVTKGFCEEWEEAVRQQVQDDRLYGGAGI